MASYKLHSFNLRARAEVIRLAFTQAEIQFEDVRYQYPPGPEWLEIKKDLPFGRVPVLEINGEKVTESNAIAHYVAKKFGLSGSNAYEEAKVYEVFFISQDIIEAAWKAYFEKDENIRAKLKHTFLEEALPRLLNSLDTLLGDERYFVGKCVTLADLNVFTIVDGIHIKSKENNKLGVIIQKYHRLNNHRDRIATIPSIAAYLETRPDTPF